MAEMVWCKSCKTVIWAYDQQPKIDLGGIVNMLGLPCPKCGNYKNFDGWGFNNLSERDLSAMERISNEPVYDAWSAMKAIAKSRGLAWEPSGDNTWKWESTIWQR